MSELLIAEELFLLTHDDETGKSSSASMSPDAVLAGALLLDLAEQALISIDDAKKVLPTAESAAHPLLAEAQAAITADKKTRSVSHWVQRLPSKIKGLPDRVGDSLVHRGVLMHETGKVLGVFTSTRWPERDPEPERRLRAGLADVLARGAAPTPHQALLVPLLAGQNLISTLVEKDERKTAKATAKQLVAAAKDGKLVSAEVSQTVQATQAAIMVAVFVPVIVSSN